MIHLHHLIHHLIHIYYYIKYLFNPSFDTHLILVYYVLTRFIAICNWVCLLPFVPFITNSVLHLLPHHLLQFTIWVCFLPFIPFITSGI